MTRLSLYQKMCLHIKNCMNDPTEEEFGRYDARPLQPSYRNLFLLRQATTISSDNTRALSAVHLHRTTSQVCYNTKHFN